MYFNNTAENKSGLDLGYLVFNYRGNEKENTYAYRFLGLLWFVEQTKDRYSHQFNPIWQYQSKGDWMGYSLFWILFRYNSQGDNYAADVLFRLWHQERNRDFSALEFHPLFMYNSGKDEGTNLSLLYYLFRTHNGEKEMWWSFLGGFLGYSSDDAKNASSLRVLWFLNL
jgi:hypothetical protein